VLLQVQLEEGITAANGAAPGKFNTRFDYESGLGGSSTTKVSKITNGTNAIEYSYDRNGNIESIISPTPDGKKKRTEYHYDDLNQLVREEEETYVTQGSYDKLLAYYTFDDLTTGAVGTKVKDVSGNLNDGIVRGAGTVKTTAAGKALEFDGISTWVELEDMVVPDEFTISIKLNSNAAKNQSFIGKKSFTAENTLLFGYWNSMYHVNMLGEQTQEQAAALGEQHLILSVKKGTGTQSLLTLYKNSSATKLWDNKVVSKLLGNTQGEKIGWALGQEFDGTTPSDFFSGTMDEVAIYGYAVDAVKAGEIFTNGVKGSTIKTATTYTYDVGGNIKSKNKVQVDANFNATALAGGNYSLAYGDTVWKDKLTSYTADGKVHTIDYDSIGNPLTIKDSVGNAEQSMQWEAGRQLGSISNKDYTLNLKYNDEGIRTEKSVTNKSTGATTVTKYHLSGDQVTFEETGNEGIYYTYDSTDNLVSIAIMNKDASGKWILSGEYFYVRNAQNDIIGLVDKTGAQVVTYSYDSWGKALSTTGSLASTVGEKNPYRYRGYRYDTETQLYYLQSRYYSPEWGRFINADTIVGEVGELLSHNMFAYCNSDPVNMEDPDGDIAWWVGAAIGGAVFDSAIYLFQHRNGGFSWGGLGKAAVAGAITGVAVAGAGKYIAKGVKAIISARKARRAKALLKGACFTEDTPILTKDGAKPIKEIKVGDEVYSENPETGKKGLKKVTNVFINETDKLIHLYVDGEEIKTTSEHPFWVVGEGWVGAEDLRTGDLVLLYSGKIASIQKLTVEELDNIIKVYNFEVEDWHTYFVSNQNVLVHNSCSATTKLLQASKNLADHHIIPAFRGKSAKYARFIKKRGINVDNFTVTLSHGKNSHHLKFIHGQGKWNQRWMDWIDANPNATAKDIYQFAGRMMDQYGLSSVKIHPYKK
jgi:RHS repeat-associated protein